jgi:hypothetical protein
VELTELDEHGDDAQQRLAAMFCHALVCNLYFAACVQDGGTLGRRAAGNPVEVRLRVAAELPGAFCDVGANGWGGAAQLVSEFAASLRQVADDGVCRGEEIDGEVVDIELVVVE